MWYSRTSSNRCSCTNDLSEHSSCNSSAVFHWDPGHPCFISLSWSSLTWGTPLHLWRNFQSPPAKCRGEGTPLAVIFKCKHPRSPAVGARRERSYIKCNSLFRLSAFCKTDVACWVWPWWSHTVIYGNRPLKIFWKETTQVLSVKAWFAPVGTINSSVMKCAFIAQCVQSCFSREFTEWHTKESFCLFSNVRQFHKILQIAFTLKEIWKDMKCKHSLFLVWGGGICQDKMEAFTTLSFLQVWMKWVKKKKKNPQSLLEPSQKSSSTLHAWTKQS